MWWGGAVRPYRFYLIIANDYFGDVWSVIGISSSRACDIQEEEVGGNGVVEGVEGVEEGGEVGKLEEVH